MGSRSQVLTTEDLGFLTSYNGILELQTGLSSLQSSCKSCSNHIHGWRVNGHCSHYYILIWVHSHSFLSKIIVLQLKCSFSWHHHISSWFSATWLVYKDSLMDISGDFNHTKTDDKMCCASLRKELYLSCKQSKDTQVGTILLLYRR